MKETEGRSRPKYLRLGESGVGTSAPEGDSAPAFTVTRGELVGMMRQACEEARAAGAALLVDRQGLARLLDCSAGQVDALRKRGLPTTMVGQLPRFEPPRVIEWLRAQPSEGESHASHG
jgi:hypothetical protein